jgi:CheY-like chemotaxis protein
MGSGAGRKLLLVEDTEEVRRTLASFLRDEGFDVTTASTAEEGLAILAAKRFELIVSDYVLPGETGTWMLKQANASGFLENVGVVVYTGHPGPEGADNFRVIGRPADLDDLLRTIEEAAADTRLSSVPLPRSTPRVEKTPARLELVLYISAHSPSSLRALRNFESVLSEFEPGEVAYAVCDLATDFSGAADADRIAFTPTLVKRHPLPKEWFLGDLTNTDPIRAIFLDAQVSKAR